MREGKEGSRRKKEGGGRGRKYQIFQNCQNFYLGLVRLVYETHQQIKK
jgi:hypothetical protein